MTDHDVAKRAAGRAAADLVTTGTRIGLGTGSTFLFALERLAERIRNEALEVQGVPTSSATASAAAELGVPLCSLDDVDGLDLAIDGADEVDPAGQLIKGGGGALLREKIVARAARELIVIVGEDKLVPRLGATFPLPVEILAFGHRQTIAALAAAGMQPELRRRHDGRVFETDGGNWIADCHTLPDEPLIAIAARLDGLIGVVEHGLFLDMTGRIIVADASGSVTIRS